MAEPLPVPDEAPQAIRSTPHGSQVRELLAVYQAVLNAGDDLSLMPMVLWKRRGRVHYHRRPKWFVRYLLVRHIHRSLTDLSRRYSARAALEQAALGEDQDREAVRDFLQSLPPDRHKVYLVLLIAAIVVLVRPITTAVVPAVNELIKVGTGAGGFARWLAFKSGGVHSAQQLSKLTSEKLQNIEEVASLSVTSIDQAVNALLSGGRLEPAVLSVLALGVALSTYVVLLPFLPAFLLKRMLFNVSPEPTGGHRSAVARWSVSQATGLYDKENRVFAELGERPPTEFPFDLAVSALAMVLPLICCGLLFTLGVSVLSSAHRATAVRVGGFTTLGAVCLLFAILVWLGWLYRTWRRRQLGRSGPYSPFEVGIRDGKTVAKVEDPIGWRLPFFLVFSLLMAGTLFVTAISDGNGFVSAFGLALLGPLLYGSLAYWLVSLPWWYRINCELRNLDRSYDSQETGIRPRDSLLLMMTAGFCTFSAFLACIAVYRVGRKIQMAQERAAQPVTAWSPWVLVLLQVPGPYLSPVLFTHLQRELNKIWKAEGQPLDPWPAESSPEANRSTGTLPWLKPRKRSTD
jgi:hypothetical protein